jgi:hypothetical protein
VAASTTSSKIALKSMTWSQRRPSHERFMV